MNKQQEALKLALEALEMVDRDDNDRDFLMPAQCYQLDEAITAIREALADSALDRMAENARELGLDYEPAQQQEPVAVYVGETWCGSVVRLYEDLPLETPLYTSPPAQRKPLTGEQIRALWDKEAKPERSTAHFFTAFARAIEAAHGIKGDA